MIISKICSKLDKDQQEGLVLGLVLGLASGLASGLAWGLVLGLVWGLVLGLVWGLVWGLASGLVLGLVWGLVVIIIHFQEAFPFLIGFYPILIIIIAIVFISEVLFWLMKNEKVKKKNLFKYVLKRKAECILGTLMGFSFISQVYILTKEFSKYLDYQLFQEILKWVGYLGIGIIVLIIIGGIFYIWIKLDSLKYSKRRNQND